MPTSMPSLVVFLSSSTVFSVARKSASPAEAVVSKSMPSAPTSAMRLQTKIMSSMQSSAAFISSSRASSTFIMPSRSAGLMYGPSGV